MAETAVRLYFHRLGIYVADYRSLDAINNFRLKKNTMIDMITYKRATLT